LVMTVLQSAAGVSAAGAFAVPRSGCAGQTPIKVMTAASGGTSADVSAGGWACCSGVGAAGAACPQASAPKKTHISQILNMSHFLQDWSFRKLKMAKQEIVAQAAAFARPSLAIDLPGGASAGFNAGLCRGDLLGALGSQRR
jgi:hypothetical protein